MKVTILEQPTVKYDKATYLVDIRIDDINYSVAHIEVNGSTHTFIKDPYGSPPDCAKVVRAVDALFESDDFNYKDRSQWLADKVFELDV